MSYDGFISYSHAADDLLAPRLQSALQRFAKPWWKRRALRVFRDESSLSANPHLWESITQALDTSGWFVLLLSPDAAGSEWVNQEVTYWVKHKDPSKILPVVTAGEFGWVDGEVTGDAVPDALRGVFASEPRWVDLRFAKGEEQLDLQNPRFADAIADVASAMRGVPKDELASEEVRQHRRTVRTAWAAGAVVTVLAVVAAWAGFVASQNAEEAQANAAEAERQAEAADLNAAEADRQRKLAEENAAAAQENANRADAEARAAQAAEAVAKARELAAAALVNLETQPELATLLALLALDEAPEGDDPPVELVNAIWQVGSADRLVDEITTGFGGEIGLSPDGTRLAATVAPQTLRMYDAHSHEVLWEYSEETVDSFVYPVVGPTGKTALGVFDSELEWHDYVAEPDELPSRIVILSADGSVEATLEYPDCPGTGNIDWSADGRFLAVGNVDVCLRDGQTWIDVYETETWTRVAAISTGADPWSPPSPRFDANGRLYALISWGYNEIYEAETFELAAVTDASGVGDVAPDGSRMYGFYARHGYVGEGGTPFSVNAYDSETGAITDIVYTGIRYPDPPFGVTATDDGRYVIVGAGGYSYVYDPLTGEEKLRIPSRPLGTSGYDAEGELLYTAAEEGIRVWDLGSAKAGVTPTGDLGALTWVNGNSFVIGDGIGAFEQADLATDAWATGLFDLETGEVIGSIPDSGPHAVLANGKLFLNLFSEGYDASGIYDPADGSLRRFFECESYNEDGQCTEEGYNFVVSLDRTEVLAYPWAGERLSGVVHTLDLDTGEILRTDDLSEGDLVAAEMTESWVLGFPTSRIDYRVVDRSTGEVVWQDRESHIRHEVSRDGRWLLTRGDQEVQLVDTRSWEVRWMVGGFNNIRGTAFDDESGLLAVSDFDSVRIIDIETGLFVQQVQLPGVSDVHFLDEERVVVGTRDGVFGVLSLSTKELIDRTRANLRRSFTLQECEVYRIDPCPTLDEMRTG